MKPDPCCVPSVARALHLTASRAASAARLRTRLGSTAGMIKLEGGRFLMGTESTEGFPADGEGPIREVILDPFYMDTCPVTNRQFAEFVQRTDYKTEAERFDWSFVFHTHIPRVIVEDTVRGVTWWCKVRGACWRHPEGPDSDVDSRPEHPVTQVSWNDAIE
jgi:sulfatase modifying factor 1